MTIIENYIKSFKSKKHKVPTLPDISLKTNSYFFKADFVFPMEKQPPVEQSQGRIFFFA